MQIIELKYSSTNTYLIEGRNGLLLFDTGWAGTFRAFCREMGEKEIPVQKISYILMSHFHPDHCGIAQEIADCGAVIAVPDVQQGFIHSADRIFEREPEKRFCPIDDRKIRLIDLKDSRSFLAEIGIDGEIIATPGHSDDSISLLLDDGSLLVGDLNPLYELEMHRGTQIGQSWEKLLARKPTTVYFGHAKTAHLEERQSRSDAVNVAGRQINSDVAYMAEMQEESDKMPTVKQQSLPYTTQTTSAENKTGNKNGHEYALVKRIMKYTDKGFSAEKIQKKTGAPLEWIKDAMRMYLTHTNVSVQGILDRLEIRGR